MTKPVRIRALDRSPIDTDRFVRALIAYARRLHAEADSGGTEDEPRPAHDQPSRKAAS